MLLKTPWPWGVTAGIEVCLLWKDLEVKSDVLEWVSANKAAACVGA